MGRKQRMRLLAERVFPYSARLALMLADRRARALERRAGRDKSPVIPTQAELDALFGPGVISDYAAVSRGCSISQARSRLIKDIGFKQGPSLIRPLIDVDGMEHLERLKATGRGVILATWHSGPTPAVWATLLDFGIRLMKIQAIDTPFEQEGWTALRRQSNEFDGIRILKTCSKHLRGGGWVGAAFDVNEKIDRKIDIPYFGRSVPYPLGLPVLALTTGAPIVPIVARWALDEPRIKVQIHEPMEVSELAPQGGVAGERVILERLVSRMESFFRAHPEELSRAKVGVLLKFPKIQ